MYKVGIDGRLYGQTGVGVYLRNLLYYLQRIKQKEFIFYIYLMKQDYDKLEFKSESFIRKIADYKWHTFSEQFGFLKTLYADKLDLMHFTYFSYPVLYNRRFIATIHDLTPLSYKTGKASTKNPLIYEIKFFAFKTVLDALIKKAKIIITPSKTVKEQLIKYYSDKYVNKIESIYEGVDYRLILAKENTNLSKKFKGNYFIYVGNFYPHKNVDSLIKAFTMIDKNLKLILIGPNDFFAQRMYQLINQLKQDKRIVFYHNPKDSDLVFFYKNAKALINPSLSEGFGLPLIEASYFKLPIIASDIDVFKEILGNKYIAFNPKNINNIVSKILSFLNKENKHQLELPIDKFSFRKMTEETLNIYKKVLYQR